jgi:hypothetical protein
MGLSSKKTKTTSNQSTAPTAYSQPYIDSAAATLKPAYEESMAAAKAYQPGLQAAGAYYGDVMGGKFLDSNPYIDDIVSSSNSDAADAVNSAFMPRFGSGYHAKTLARAIGDNTARIRGGAYDQERQYQNDAGGRLAGIATVGTALPGIASSNYAQNAGGLMGRYLNQNGTQTTKQSGSIMDVLGMGLQAASLFSDERLKTDVRRVGRTDAGLTVYIFRYGGAGPFHMGVMAQEVRAAQPAALGRERAGYMTVNYRDVR